MKETILDLPPEQRDAALKQLGLTAEEFRARYVDAPDSIADHPAQRRAARPVITNIDKFVAPMG